jgi:hypothetical protein
MGWSSGSRLFGDVIESLKKHVPDEESRQAIYIDLIDAFEDFDCDTLEECTGEDEVFDDALKEAHPDWYDEEEDEEE